MLGTNAIRIFNFFNQSSGLTNIRICVNRHMENEKALALSESRRAPRTADDVMDCTSQTGAAMHNRATISAPSLTGQGIIPWRKDCCNPIKAIRKQIHFIDKKSYDIGYN